MSVVKKKILIMHHGPLRDFLFASAAFQAMRDAYSDDVNIILLTTDKIAKIAKNSGFFDEVIIDEMPNWLQPKKWLFFRKWLLNSKFLAVIDLSNNQRTQYYCIMAGRTRPKWCRSSDFCSNPFFPSSPILPLTEIYQQQMQASGLDVELDRIDISWLLSDNVLKTGRFLRVLAEHNFTIDSAKYFIICVDGSRDDKWNDYSFAELICWLQKQDIITVIIGNIEDIKFANLITKHSQYEPNPSLNPLNLVGKLYENEILELAYNAIVTIGGDNGLSYICSLSDCPTIILYNKAFNLQRYSQNTEFFHSFFEKDLTNVNFENIRPIIDDIMADYVHQVEYEITQDSEAMQDNEVTQEHKLMHQKKQEGEINE